MNTDNLRAEFARNRKNQKEIAKLLGISEKTLISRMRNGDFRLTEVEEDGMGDRAFIKYIPNQLQKGAPNGKSTGRICRVS